MGVSTNKPWLDVRSTRLDANREQYDSCVQFNLRFWPPEAEQALDLDAACITSCCWRSQSDEIVLDFNKNFERDLQTYGSARRYSPEKITLKVTHSNMLNFTKVAVSPARAINNKGLVKLSYEVEEDPARMEQLRVQQKITKLQNTLEEISAAARAQKSHLILEGDTAATDTKKNKSSKKKKEKEKKQTETAQAAQPQAAPDIPAATASRISVAAAPKSTALTKAEAEQQAKQLLRQKAGLQIDTYFYDMNKTYRDKQAIFMLGERTVEAKANKDHTYTLTCSADARTGIEENRLNASIFSCGTWLVDLTAQTVTPYDNKAIQIMNK